MELEVAMIYARALYGAATDNGCAAEIRDEILQIDHIFRDETDFQKVMANPAISVVKKRDMLKNVFKGRIHRELLNFMYVLVDKGRFYGLHKMIKFYYDLDDEARGEGYGIVYSVCPLDETQIGRFEDEVSKLFRKKIHLNNKIEKKLIGGVRLLVEGKFLDASMAGRLDQIAEKIGVFG